MASPFPAWLTKRLPAGGTIVSEALADLSLNTVCRSARCPNRHECYAAGAAAFLLLGAVCTRNCRFCAVPAGQPAAPDASEPGRIAEAAERLGLRYVVITSVARDDLADGGAAHFAAAIRAVRERTGTAVEVLAPDFGGNAAAVASVLAAGPAVFNHNIETVPRLYPQVRPQADYQRSLSVLRLAARRGALVKSGLMVGLGEMEDEVIAVLRDLRAAGVSLVTIGQYLSPRGSPLAVHEFVPPGQFERYERMAYELGFTAAACGPFVRSSYHAPELAAAAASATMTAKGVKGKSDGSKTA